MFPKVRKKKGPSAAIIAAAIGLNESTSRISQALPAVVDNLKKQSRALCKRKMTLDYLESIQTQIIGRDLAIKTPFGQRHLLYADYTASGRAVQLIEDRISNILTSYANTHTEDDYTGKFMTGLLHQAENRIKELVNAGKDGRIISVGSGTTKALLKLQQILGIYLSPATKDRFYQAIKRLADGGQDLLDEIERVKPVVFVSAYEHHSNELMWRESFSEVVVVGLDEQGLLDMEDLEAKLSSEQYRDRYKLASFSAGSNITGVKTDIYEVARICHKHEVPVMFDFAAIAPYVKIDMNRDKESYFDAIFFSPHKFLGGPGASGVLIFNKKLYRNELPPTAAGGGTVDYVGYHSHDFTEDIEAREKAGTPGIIQTIRSALVMELKEKIGCDVIQEREEQFARLFFDRLGTIPNVQLIGAIPVDKRVPIISFNIKHKDRFLHPKFVTKLLNDLFGIQSRAGCSCAGPYGHYLLGISEDKSDRFRSLITRGNNAIKPGWVRVNLHYSMEENDIRYLLDAIEFVAKSGHLFLRKYLLNTQTGEWALQGFQEEHESLSIDNTFDFERIDMDRVEELRRSYFAEAETLAGKLEKEGSADYKTDTSEIEEIKFFYEVMTEER